MTDKIIYVFQLILTRLQTKYTPHAPGSKKPTLSQLDSTK